MHFVPGGAGCVFYFQLDFEDKYYQIRVAQRTVSPLVRNFFRTRDGTVFFTKKWEKVGKSLCLRNI